MNIKELEEIIKDYANLDEVSSEDCVCLIFNSKKLAKYIEERLNDK